MGRWALVAVIAVGCGPSVFVPGEPAGGTTGAISSTTSLGGDGPGNDVSGDGPSIGTTSSTSASTSTGIAESSDGFTFILGRDAFVDPCDLWAQDCPRGEKCMPWGTEGTIWNAVRCSPIVDDPAGAGEPCVAEESGLSGIDDCDINSMCWAVDPDTLEGYCLPLCEGAEDDPTCTDPCRECTIANDGILPLCLAACDPVASDCQPGERCTRLDEFRCTPYLDSPNLPIGEPCDYDVDCAPGLACAQADTVLDCLGAPACCTPYCNTEGPNPCPPGTTCTPLGVQGTVPRQCGPAPTTIGTCTL